MRRLARTGVIGIALLIGTGAFATAPDDVWRAYSQAINHACPAKRLDWLAPAELRDALDDYKTHAAHATLVKMDKSERQACRRSIAGAGCFNLGDLEVAARHGELMPIAAMVCGRFAICRGQSDCDAIPAPPH